MAVAVALEEAVAAKDLRSRRGRQAGARQLPHHARGDRAVGASCTAGTVHRGCLAGGCDGPAGDGTYGVLVESVSCGRGAGGSGVGASVSGTARNASIT